MRENNRERLRMFCESVEKEGWEIIFVTELKVKESRMV